MITNKIMYKSSNLKKNEIVLDIETTGLSPIEDKLVLLGMITYEKDIAYLIQYFAENDSEEKKLLTLFLEKSKNKKIITYNGDIFDLPFLKSRLKINKLESDLFFETFDIYKIIRAKKYYIDFDSMKLIDVEKMIDIERNDPSRYKSRSKLNDLIKSRDNPKPILIHNKNDLISTENLIDIENIIKKKLSIKFNSLVLYFVSSSINNDLIKIELEASKSLGDSYFTSPNYQLIINKKYITIYTGVLYGKISPQIGGYVTKNIHNLESKSNYKINPNLLILKEGRRYNCPNILNFCLSIIKENLIL